MVSFFQLSKKLKLGQKTNKQWPQVVAALTITTYNFLIGTSSIWTSPAIPKLMANDSYIPMTFEETTNLGIIPSVSMCLFSPFAGPLGDTLGRKRSCYVVSLLLIISWLIIAFARKTIMIYISRAMTGMVLAIFLSSIPCYIAETTEKHIRGRLAIIMSIQFTFGALVINLGGYYLSISGAALVFALCPLVHFFVFIFMPESPYWLIQKKQFDKAKKELQILRWREDVEIEFAEIVQAVEDQTTESSSYKDIFTVPCNRKALVIAVILRFAQHLAGNTAISNFMQFIFEEAGGEIPRHFSASLCALFSGIAGISFTGVIDRYGRRPALLIASTGCSIFLFLMGTFLYLKTQIDLNSFSYLPLVFMLIYLLFYYLGLAGIPILMMGELFSSSIKSKAVVLIIVVHGAILIFTTKIFQVFVDNVGLYSPFLFFAVATVVMTVVVYFTVIETKNKSLDEIQMILKEKSTSK